MPISVTSVSLKKTRLGFSYFNIDILKIRMFLYRPEEVLRISGGWGSQISRQSVHEGGKVFSPSHRPPLPRRRYPWYSLVLEAESTTGPYIKHNILSRFQTFAVFWMVYAFFLVIPLRLNFIYRRFGTLFHLHRRIESYPPMKMEQGIP